MLLCPNTVVNIPNEMARKRKLFNFGMIKRLAMPLNVGKRANGKTFISGINDSGNHWALVIVELRPFRRIIYCDTLAWDPPSNLVNVVNNFTSHIPRVEDFNESHLSVAHSPLATSRTGHFCDWRCRNYPLQTCSDICGVIVLINAALAALNRSFFQYLIDPYEKEKIFIQRPTQHSNYLRRVVMAWFSEGRIDIDYVLPNSDWRQSNTTPAQFDHTFCFRQDTSINSKKKFKLSLNHHVEATKDPTPPKESSPIFPRSSSTAHEQAASIKPCMFTSPNPTCEANNSNCGSTVKPQLKTHTSSGITSKDSTKERNHNNKAKNSSSDSKIKPAQSKTPTSESTNNADASSSRPLTKVKESKHKNKGKPSNSSKVKPQSKIPTLSESTNNHSSQPLPSSTGPSTSPAATKPASPHRENSADFAPADSVPLSKASTKCQCEHCGLQLSSRNCLYKHKMRKHKASGENVKKAVQSKHVLCPDSKENESR